MDAIIQTHSLHDPRWPAVVARDPAQDGRFVFAVTTTGIYCRPSCPARRPQPQNVRFFASWVAAEKAGFRACLRCRPRAPSPRARHAAMIAAACRDLDAEAPPSLEALATKAGLSRFHFHRLFKALTGVTPLAYAKARRAARIRTELVAAPRVTDAIYAAGFGSNSRFYERSDLMLGMKPAAFRDAGKAVDILYAIGSCSLGCVLVARSEIGICAVMLGDDPAALAGEIKARFVKARSIETDTEFAGVLAKVIACVEAPAKDFDLPLDIRGTLFQQKVWAALRAIPVGETASYAEVARRIGAPRATRAVAAACAANKIAVVIPCHRVLRSDGGLSGYRWGVTRKRALLDKERKG
jgi:AraC family transcriptional regulator, regulatory protein of adaptative response / methylated-DNA-[protein]-cysteine methyltransferase